MCVPVVLHTTHVYFLGLGVRIFTTGRAYVLFCI